jgi:ABC-type dipeptide/oligopeptide/nickel transport system ATPase subunit
MSGRLEALDVSKTYQRGSIAVSAVQSVSMAVDEGQIVLVMGPSGSGRLPCSQSWAVFFDQPPAPYIWMERQSANYPNPDYPRYADRASGLSSRLFTSSPS